MKVQHNEKTHMSWIYISTAIVRFLGLAKGDTVEFIPDEKTNKVEFRKIIKE